MKLKNLDPALMLWAGVALLLLAAIYAPVSRPDIPDEAVDIMRMDAFSPLVIAIDRNLVHGEPIALSALELRQIEPIVQSRRLLTAGPMTTVDLKLAVDVLRDFQRQLESQEKEGSREAIRHHRNRVLSERFPRLDADKIALVLAELHGELEAQR